MDTVAPRKTERIEIRVTPEERQLLQEAAWQEGTTISAFVLSVAVEMADKLTSSFRATVVSPEKFDELLAWLDEPPVVDEKLVEGFRRLRELEGNWDELLRP